MKLSDYIGQVSGFVPEAPIDGNEYARKNATWVTVTGGGGGIGEAPADGQVYARDGSTQSWELTFSAAYIITNYAPINHTHTGVYAPVSHTHTESQITDLKPYLLAPSDGNAYARTDSAWVLTYSQAQADTAFAAIDHDHAGVYQPVGSYLTDAPSDGNQYARKDGGWAVVVGGGGGLEDAPSNGLYYGRRNGAWSTVAASSHSHSISNVSGLQTALDGKADNGHSHSGLWSVNGSYIYYNNRVGIKDSTPSYDLDVAGTIRATANVIAYSDARLKDDIQPIEGALDKVNALDGVSFTRNDMADTRRHIGVIAQQVQNLVPEVVHEDDDGMLSVAYGPLVGLLIEAIKELDAKIEALG